MTAPITGTIVRYRGKQGALAPRAAIVTADVNTLDPGNVAAGHVPALDDESHVHLWVFSPGERGGFTEYNVPEAVDPDDIPPGSWAPHPAPAAARMGTGTPTIGRIVHYVLSEQDAQAINKRRTDYDLFRRQFSGPSAPGTSGADGHQAHVGNRAEAGQVYPAMVVRTFGGSAANLQVFLDGNDTYWGTSRSNHEGDTGSTHSVNTPDISYHGGSWHWPPRV